MLRGFPKGRRKTEIVLEINELHFSGSKAHWGMLSLMHMGWQPRCLRFMFSGAFGNTKSD